MVQKKEQVEFVYAEIGAYGHYGACVHTSSRDSQGQRSAMASAVARACSPPQQADRGARGEEVDMDAVMEEVMDEKICKLGGFKDREGKEMGVVKVLE